MHCIEREQRKSERLVTQVSPGGLSDVDRILQLEEEQRRCKSGWLLPIGRERGGPLGPADAIPSTQHVRWLKTTNTCN